MSVNDWTTGAGKSTQGFGTGALCDGQVAVAYDGYTTDKTGTIVVKSYFNTYSYRQDENGQIWKLGKATEVEANTPGAQAQPDGKWVIRAPDEPVPADQQAQAYRETIYLRFKVISPTQWYGAEATAGCKLAGIEFPDGPDTANLYIVMSGNAISALIKFAMAAGLKESGFNNAAVGYDPAYALPYLRTLEFPLTPLQVFLKVIDPLLRKHASEGKLFVAEVKPRKKETDTGNFLDQATAKAVDYEDAQRIWAEVTAAEEADKPEEIPFPGDPAPAATPAPAAPQPPAWSPTPPPTAQPPLPTTPAPAPQPAQQADRDQLEQQVRALIDQGKATGEQVLGWIDEMGKLPLDTNQSALGSLDAEGLQAVLAKINTPSGPRL
jgi:hypothetical protein